MTAKEGPGRKVLTSLITVSKFCIFGGEECGLDRRDLRWASTSLLERVADWDSRICGSVVRIWIEWRGYLVGKNERRTFMLDFGGMTPPQLEICYLVTDIVRCRVARE